MASRFCGDEGVDGFGKDLVFVGEFEFEFLDFLVPVVGLAGAEPFGIEEGGAAFEELPLPVVELRGGDSELLAEVGDWGSLEEVFFEDTDFFSAVETASLLFGHD
jgi:hypothetical protein